MKYCSKCKVFKDLSEFFKNNFTNDGYCYKCKICAGLYKRKYRKTSTGKLKDQISHTKRHKRLVKEKSLLVLERLSEGCIDCKEKDIIVLQFDHLSDKIQNIAKLRLDDGPVDKFILEMNKCVIRCANCHIRKTAKERNWWKLDLKQ